MNFILFIIFLSVVANTKCDEIPVEIKVIEENIHGLRLMNKNLFSKLDSMLNEIVKLNTNFNIITERLQEQDEKNNQLPKKPEINELMKFSHKQEAEINEDMKFNHQVFQKLNQQDEKINTLLTKGQIIELINTNITESNQQIFQKLNQQDEKINKLSTKGEIGQFLELINTNITELNQQIFQKLNQQDEKINQLPTKDEISDLMKLSNKQEAQISEVLEKVNTIIPEMSENESFNKTENEKLQNPLLKYNISYSKSTKEINKMLSNQPIKEMGNWLVILRRQDGSEDFDRNWLDYQNGFGNPNGEFFIGMEKLHAFTTNGGRHELLIILGDFEGVTKYANYDHFVVGNETEKYELQKLGYFDGDVGDSMAYHLNAKFSTKDQDNDLNDVNCAALAEGGWWFSGLYCFDSHLTGPYYDKPTSIGFTGISWNHRCGYDYSLKFVEMMVRPIA